MRALAYKGSRKLSPAMTTLTLDSSSPQSLSAGGSERLMRDVLFLATFLFIWLTASPFPDLSDPKLLEPNGEGNLIGQALAILVTLALGAFVFVKRSDVVRKALTPILVLTFLWFACSAALSSYPGLAARKLVLAALTIFQAAVFLLVPQGRDHFSRLLAVGALIVLLLCYAGVIFLPELSIHHGIGPGRARPRRQLARLLHPQERRRRRHGGPRLHRHFRRPHVQCISRGADHRARGDLPGVHRIEISDQVVAGGVGGSASLLTRLRNPAAKFVAAISVPAVIAAPDDRLGRVRPDSTRSSALGFPIRPLPAGTRSGALRSTISRNDRFSVSDSRRSGERPSSCPIGLTSNPGAIAPAMRTMDF